MFLSTTDWMIILHHIQQIEPDIGTDNEGQVVIYTGLFKHSDGELYDGPEVISTISQTVDGLLAEEVHVEMNP